MVKLAQLCAVFVLAFVVVGSTQDCSAERLSNQDPRLFGVFRGTCIHYERQRLVAAVYALTGYGGFFALYDDNGGCTHAMTDYDATDGNLTALLVRQATQGWKCTNASTVSFALGPDGQQARGTVSDNQGTTAHCDIAQIVAVQPSQPTFSSAATTSTASNPLIPSVFSGRTVTPRSECRVASQLMTGPGLSEGNGYFWFWGSCNEKGFECFYVIKNLKQQGSAANTFSMELERFKDYDVPACQALASTSAVYDPATHTFNMTSTTTKQSATYNSTLVADVIAT